MTQSAKNFSEDSSHFSDSESHKKLTSSFVNFCEKMGSVFEIKNFLLNLKVQIPKKFKTGELILFYESKQTGLRRAYVRAGIFYEQEAKSIWPVVNTIQPSSREHNLYLAHETGRPFSKTLMVPFQHSELETIALLFIEVSRGDKLFELLTDFFKERSFVLNLIFKRVLLNTNFTRISYLWSQLFTYWWEPLAILQNLRVIRSNDAFKEVLSAFPDLLKQDKLSGLIEAGNKIYQTHYYPISQFKNLKQIGILYCQDMTKHFHLKEWLFQSEKMTSLYELGKNMAHQLNNPLTGVKSMIQILNRRSGLDDFREELVEVEKAVKRSQNIIKSLLSFSQLQDKQEICNLNQVVEDSLLLLKGMTKGLLLKIDLCKQPVEVKGNFSVLQQVVYNLVLNACQALTEDEDNREASLQIRTDKISDNQGCLKVTDNGPGIAKHNLEKIFHTFWTSKKKGQGTGLGLGIARRFVEELGGKLFVSSREKEWTCFTIIFPLNCSDKNRESLQWQAEQHDFNQ